jgi:hypothetical protein
MLPGHIVTGKGIELAKLLPGLIGRSLELLPGHIVTGKGIELAKLLPGLIMSAAGERRFAAFQLQPSFILINLSSSATP